MSVAIRLTLATFSLIFAIACLAEQDANTQQKSLTSITNKIKQWRTYLSKHEKQKKDIQQQLKLKEKTISDTNQKLKTVSQQIQTQRVNLKKLQREHSIIEKRLSDQQLLFSKQLRDTFLFSQPHTLKILLNQDNPNQVGRQLILYRYLLKKKVALLAQLQDNLSTLDTTKQEIENTQQHLVKLRKLAQQSQKNLLDEKKQRQKLLSQLNQEVHTGNTKLSQLNHEKQALEQIIAKIQKQQQPNKPRALIQPRQRQSIAHFKHKLPWPTYGLIKHRFGDMIETSDLSWHGILIGTPEGRAVRAIYPGKVVFADWLQGFGFMLILDHGDGILSLYARNESLQKQEGDSVRTQEVIALSGKSGGFSESGLYFELRREGKPVNPQGWLKKN